MKKDCFAALHLALFALALSMSHAAIACDTGWHQAFHTRDCSLDANTCWQYDSGSQQLRIRPDAGQGQYITPTTWTLPNCKGSSVELAKNPVTTEVTWSNVGTSPGIVSVDYSSVVVVSCGIYSEVQKKVYVIFINDIAVPAHCDVTVSHMTDTKTVEAGAPPQSFGSAAVPWTHGNVFTTEVVCDSAPPKKQQNQKKK